MKILTFPDDVEQLRQAAKPVTPEMVATQEFKDNLKELEALLDKEEYGVGIAAPQAGWGVSLFILNCDEKFDEKLPPKVYLNPVILDVSKSLNRDSEGCLSFPGLFMRISRPYKIEWTYEGLDFSRVTTTSHDYFARAIQHEVEHCNGKLFIDIAPDSEMHKFHKWIEQRNKE